MNLILPWYSSNNISGEVLMVAMIFYNNIIMAHTTVDIIGVNFFK